MTMTPPKKRAPEPEFPSPSSESLRQPPTPAISAAAPAHPPSVGLTYVCEADREPRRAASEPLPPEPVKLSIDRWLWPVLERIFVGFIRLALLASAVMIAILTCPDSLSLMGEIVYGLVVGTVSGVVGFVISRSDRRRMNYEAWEFKTNSMLYDVLLEQKYDGHNAASHVETGCRCRFITGLLGDQHLVVLDPCKRVTW